MDWMESRFGSQDMKRGIMDSVEKVGDFAGGVVGGWWVVSGGFFGCWVMHCVCVYEAAALHCCKFK